MTADREAAFRAVALLMSSASHEAACAFAKWCVSEAVARTRRYAAYGLALDVYTFADSVVRGTGAFGGYLHADIGRIAVLDYQGEAVAAFLALTDFDSAIDREPDTGLWSAAATKLADLIVANPAVVPLNRGDIIATIRRMTPHDAKRFASWCATYPQTVLDQRKIKVDSFMSAAADYAWRSAALQANVAWGYIPEAHIDGMAQRNFFAIRSFQSCAEFCDHVGWPRLGVDAVNYLINKDTER